MSEVMPQIALRLPARQLRRIESLVRRAAEKARQDGHPDSFANRSSILRQILERGADSLEATFTQKAQSPCKEPANAKRAKPR